MTSIIFTYISMECQHIGQLSVKSYNEPCYVLNGYPASCATIMATVPDQKHHLDST